MNPFGPIAISFGRRTAAAAVLAGALVAPSHALARGDSFALTGAPSMPEMAGSSVHTYPLARSVTIGIDYFTSGPEFPPPFSITSFVATPFYGSPSLVSGAAGSSAGVLVSNSFFLGSLAPLPYQLWISGVSSGTSGVDDYSGLLRLTAPVAPIQEPAIWAMALVAVGLIGIRLCRKSRLDGVRHFA